VWASICVSYPIWAGEESWSIWLGVERQQKVLILMTCSCCRSESTNYKFRCILYHINAAYDAVSLFYSIEYWSHIVFTKLVWLCFFIVFISALLCCTNVINIFAMDWVVDTTNHISNSCVWYVYGVCVRACVRARVLHFCKLRLSLNDQV